MDINDAVDAIDKFLQEYAASNDDFNPAEIRVLPSGDEMELIKVGLTFGNDVAEADLDGLKKRTIDALERALPEAMDEFQIKVRAELM